MAGRCGDDARLDAISWSGVRCRGLPASRLAVSIDPHNGETRPLDSVPQFLARRCSIHIKPKSQATTCSVVAKLSHQPLVDLGYFIRVDAQHPPGWLPDAPDRDLDIAATGEVVAPTAVGEHRYPPVDEVVARRHVEPPPVRRPT